MKYIAAFILALSSLGAQEFTLGNKVADFSLQDLNGNAVNLSEGKGKLTVVTFISTKCPISNAYNERMKELYNDYHAKGVHFLFVNANFNESNDEVRQHIQSNGFPFPVYRDKGNVVADRFGAQFTPEAYVIDQQGVLRYHGSIDDSRDASRITVKPLRAALDELLGGKTVTKAETKAFGCTIKRVKKTS